MRGGNGLTDKVYSFTKIRKQHTKSGVYALAGGLFSIAVLLFFIGFGIYKGGNMHGIFCLIPYLTMFGSLIGMIAAQKDIQRTDVAGKYLQAGLRVCEVSSVMHAVILLIGILKIIL